MSYPSIRRAVDIRKLVSICLQYIIFFISFSRLPTKKLENEEQCMFFVSDPANKGTTAYMRNFRMKENLQNYNPSLIQETRRTGTPSFVVINENLGSIFMALGFKYNNPFYEVFNEFIGRMISSGLTDYWDMEGKSNQKIVEDSSPQILIMEHLSVGFYACIIPAILAVIVFLLEICKSHGSS